MQAVVKVDKSRTIGKLDPMIFGQYLEHVEPDEHCIYGSIMDSGSALSGPNGLRTDVMAACAELQAPVVRWPGGCFADVYHWQDGIGPRQQRPVRRNWHWGGLEPNSFGTDEFLTWCEQIGTAPYINVNLGTGTMEEALRWLDYCNGNQPSSDVQLRRKHGRQEPYNVPFWGIGNEQWGSWEAGHMEAKEYAHHLSNWGQFFKKADPRIKLLGVGSHDAANPEWDLTVLRTAGHLIDYLTIHSYAHTVADDASAEEYYAVVGNALLLEERLQRASATIQSALPILRRQTPVRIALDEWNIRHMVRRENGRLALSRKSPRTLSDALFAAGVFHAMMRLAPHVAMACYVFLVNGNGVLLANADGIIRTPLYHLFQLYRRYMVGTVVETNVETPVALHALRSGSEPALNVTRELPYVDAVAVYDSANRRLSLAIINRHRNEPCEVKLIADGIENATPTSAWELHHDDVFAVNDWSEPDRLHLEVQQYLQGLGEITLKPHSLVVMQFDL